MFSFSHPKSVILVLNFLKVTFFSFQYSNPLFLKETLLCFIMFSMILDMMDTYTTWDSCWVVRCGEVWAHIRSWIYQCMYECNLMIFFYDLETKHYNIQSYMKLWKGWDHGQLGCCIVG
jgi:hypothetical protein